MTTSLQFSDLMTGLYNLWEKSEDNKKRLEEELEKTTNNVQLLTNSNLKLQDVQNQLQKENTALQQQIAELTKQLQDIEDDQKQFRKVSHIITMERENHHFKEQIAILQRRVAFYQNQCNTMKNKVQQTENSLTTEADINDKQNTTQNLVHITTDIERSDDTQHQDNTESPDNDLSKIDNLVSNDNEQKEDNKNDINSSDIKVIEKKIKGVIYYINDDGEIFDKNDDDSIGDLRGKITNLPSGKTKVKWYKSN